MRYAFSISVALSSALALGAAWLWLRQPPALDLHAGLPGLDDPDGRKAADAQHRTGQDFVFGESRWTAADAPAPRPSAAWPQFRGPLLNNQSPQETPLADTFPPEGPPRRWALKLTPGYAGATVFAGRVYLMDHKEDHGDLLRCLDLQTGTEIWHTGYRIRIASNHGITRTMPAVTDRHIVTMGPMGQVMCVDTPTGTVRWGISLPARYGTRDLSGCWYAGQCPLIENGRAIVAPAGTNVLMIAVDCESGDVLWEAPNPGGWRMSHASITPMTVDGVRMYIYPAVGGVAAIGAEGELAGQILWQTDRRSASVLMPSPVVLSGDRVFLTSGYDGGSALLHVRREPDGTFAIDEIYNFSGKRLSRDCFSTYQQTPIYHQGHLFGIQSNNARQHRLEFVCVQPDAGGGRFVWASGQETDFTAPGKREAWGPYVLADGKFYVMGDTGKLAVFEATTSACRKLGEWQLLENGHEAWGPMTIVDGLLFVRDYENLVCFDIGATGR